jgi:hypothetical protein
MKRQLTVLLTIVLVGILGLLYLPIGGVEFTTSGGHLSVSTNIAYASPDVLNSSPTTNTTGAWTNATGAYADSGTYANITSGTPSGNTTWGTYGFSLTGDTITQVRVRYDAWSIGSSGTVSQNPTANTNGTTPWTNPTYGYTSNNQCATAVYADTTSSKASPTGDGTNNGTRHMLQIRLPTGQGDQSNISSGTYTSLDECSWANVAWSTTDYVTTNTTAGYGYYTSPAFSIPAGATINSVTVYQYTRDASFGTNYIREGIKVNGIRYEGSTSHNPGTTATFYSTSWTTNPNTSAAWTVNDVNGSGANPLQQFGFGGITDNDWSPAFYICSCWCTVDYDLTGSYYTSVDETTADYTDNEYFSATSGSSYQHYTYTAFNIPSTAQNIRLKITYTGCEFATGTSAGTNNIRAGIQINGVQYDTTDSGSNPGYTPSTYTYTFSTNPNTSAAWTAADINGTGSNPLQQFGFATSDSSPAVMCAMVYAEVLYYLPHDQIYGTFGFTGSTTITKVELGYEAYSSVAEQLDLYTSSNGGSSWNTVHTTSNLGTSDPNSYTYIDVTSDTTWTWTLLNDTNFKYKVVAHWLSGSPTWSIDALVVRVTYTAANDEQIRVDVTWDGGTSWSSKQTTNLNGTETTYWVDVTSDTTWTPTKLGDANFQVRVDAMTVGADPGDVRLDWIPVEVTYSVNVAPTVGTIAISPSSMTPQEQWTNITVPVTDGDTLADVNEVHVEVFYDSAGNDPSAPGTADVQTCAILTWTRGGSPWDISPASTTWQINTGGCSNASDTLTTGNWVFSFKVGKVATHSPGSDDWDIYAKATDSISQTGDNYLRDVEMNWYGEITVETSDISWGTVSPGCSNETSPVMNITYTCNGNYSEQIKTSQNWTSASGNATLNTTGSPGTGEFSLKADDDATLVDAVQVLSASYTTFDTGTQTTESGNAENNNHLWLSLGLDIPVDTYSGTIYFGIAQ